MSTIPEKVVVSSTENANMNLSKKELLLRALAVVAVVYIFLLSIKLMGASFKLFGTGFAEQLMDYTSNPFVGLFIGILATSLVQSSSVTTSIIVGLTAGGAISVGAAVPIIMGANIGTSVTNTIVSLGHVTRKTEFKKAFEVATVHDFFNFIVVAIMFPVEIYFGVLEHAAAYLTQFFLGSNMDVHFSSPLNAIVKPVAHAIQGLLHNNAIVILVVSLVALFLALESFVKLMRPLVESNSKELLNKHVFKTPLRGFSVGLVLTAFVQSSSVASSIVVPLAGVGIIALERVFPYILGANVGTTLTALTASVVTGSPAAVTVALEHFLFNSFGSAIIWPMRKLPMGLSRFMARMSLKNRAYPFAYVASTFFILPAGIIFLFN